TVETSPVQPSPEVVDDMASTLEDTPVDIDILDNDGNIPSDGTLTVTQPDNGTVTVNDNGTPGDITDDTVIYTPDTDFVGTDEFEYTVCDKNGNCDTATVTITVDTIVMVLIDAVDDDYRANPINGTTGGIVKGSNVYSNDIYNGNPLNRDDVILTSTPTGPLTVNNDGTVTVDPNTKIGTYTIKYTICEKLNPDNCDTAT